jgi:N-acetylmuramoyl-L-alanine amidase
LGASEMRCRALVNSLLCCLAIATSAGSDLKPRIALDIGHSVKRPGAYSARGVGEYSFNKTIAEALLRSLKKSGEVEPFNSITPRLTLPGSIRSKSASLNFSAI